MAISSELLCDICYIDVKQFNTLFTTLYLHLLM